MPDPGTTSARRLQQIYAALLRQYGPQHWWPADSPFEVVIGTILTQNTNWNNVERAVANLRSANLLAPEAICRCDEDRLQQAIRPAGYFRQKAAYLKRFCQYLQDCFDGSLTRLLDQPLEPLRRTLLDCRGIGPETADSIILYAAGKPSFVIDAYTLRIFSRLGDLTARTGYAEARRLFMRLLPPDPQLYNEFHALIVAHAKAFCRKNKPLCPGCPIVRFCRYGQCPDDGLTGQA